jgi:hypothetical protein
MSLQAAAASVAPGQAPLTHVVTVASLGAAMASVGGWILQLCHVPPPPEVVAAMGVVCTVIASAIIQKVAA